MLPSNIAIVNDCQSNTLYHPTSSVLSGTVSVPGETVCGTLFGGDGIYEPELDAGANPEYYNINSVLFHAHLARLHRHNVHLPHQ